MISSPIDEIKNRLSIVEVVGSYIKLQKAGVNYRALCPFHSEKTPSFFVSPTRQIWHCFGCGKGGDIFGFVKEIEGVEFGDALRILARKAGVELKRIDPKLKTERQRLYEICEWASKFFEKQLEGKTGRATKQYLLNRRINRNSIKEWKLGYAPDTWRGLSDFLISKGYKREEIEKAGLTIKSDSREARGDKGYYDRFRGRIIFPIFDLNSQVIGFGGRIFEGQRAKPKSQKSDEAKYINTPNTLIYDKSRVLYGLDKAKLEIRKKNQCILVEGYTDVIMSHLSGTKNVVATSGTALTDSQLRILKRYSENIVTAFDMDIAGSSATERGIDLAQVRGFNIKVAILPRDLDPADVVKNNPQNWKNLINKSKNILDFYFENAFSKIDSKTAEGKREISKIILPVIRRISSKIEQSYWVGELSKKLGVREEDVWTDLQKLTPRQEVSPTDKETLQSNRKQKSRQEILEERLLTLLLKNPKNFLELKKIKIPIVGHLTSQFFEEFKKYFLKKKGSEFNLKSFKSNLSPDLNSFVDYLGLLSEVGEDFDIDDSQEFKLCLKEIQEIYLKDKLKKTELQIHEAERENNKNLDSLIQKFNTLSQKLTKLKTT